MSSTLFLSTQTKRVTPFFTSRAALVPAIPQRVFLLASLPLVCVLGESLALVLVVAFCFLQVSNFLGLARLTTALLVDGAYTGGMG